MRVSARKYFLGGQDQPNRQVCSPSESQAHQSKIDSCVIAELKVYCGCVTRRVGEPGAMPSGAMIKSAKRSSPVNEGVHV